MKERLVNDETLKENYKNYLEDKTVVLVGPAWNTKNTNQGYLIDSYDVVVRMNDGIGLAEKYPEDLGKRTDILYCNLGNRYFKRVKYKKPGGGKMIREKVFTVNSINKYNKFLKWIVASHAFKHQSNVRKIKDMTKDTKISIHLVERNIFNDIAKKNSAKLSTGIVTIYDLLQYKIKQLYITGLTFWDRDTIKVTNNKVYRAGYARKVITDNQSVYDSKKKLSFSHDTKKEILFLAGLCGKDKRIAYDKVLSKIIRSL